jgi:hypothetical protein
VKGTKTHTDNQERRERIKENRHNRKCERCTTEEIPEYLGRENVKENKMMARDLDVEREATHRTERKEVQNVL